MTHEWLQTLELPVSFDQFCRLPRNASFKYEYFGNTAWINPRPRYYHARLNLEAPLPEGNAEVLVRPWTGDDWEAMRPVFSAAFSRQIPFGTLSEEERHDAIRAALEQTRSGHDGPLVHHACLAATDSVGTPLGGLIVTLVPETSLEEWDAFMWRQPPPANLLELRGGRAHLTWIFVEHLSAGMGVGTSLLREAAPRLLQVGYRELFSTFLSGNDSSMLWHWRMGFELLPYPGSRRRRIETIGTL